MTEERAQRLVSLWRRYRDAAWVLFVGGRTQARFPDVLPGDIPPLPFDPEPRPAVSLFQTVTFEYKVIVERVGSVIDPRRVRFYQISAEGFVVEERDFLPRTTRGLAPARGAETRRGTPT